MIRGRRSRPITWLVVGMVTMLLAGAAPSAWSQTGSSSIKFLSPSSFSGEVPTITDDATDVNSSYRLSAWVAGAPQGAMVEFELIPGEGDLLTRPITIGAGRQVAADTYEYDWDIAEGPGGVVEGQHTLKVALYDAAGEEISADETTVNIFHGSSTQTAGETPIDMTYPVSGGPLGWYAPPGNDPNSVFDSKKLDSSAVQAWFTTASPGSAPVWRVCNSGEPNTRFDDGVRCTYPVDDPETEGVNEAVDPSKVTAVGLVLARDDGSADVARVFPYQQDPTALRTDVFARKTSGGIDDAKPGSLSKPKDENTGFGCSDWVRVTATDQVGRHVAGANLDAHAQGPSDQLKFHTSYLSVLASATLQPPSEGHSFPESGTRCVSTHDEIAKQGEHSMGGQPDRKHVETTSGTRDDGAFDYALESDQSGTTQLTVWLEEKDDDRFCSGEPSTAVGFGWATEQPQPNGEQPSDCPVLPDPEPEPEPIDGTRTVDIEVASTRVRTGRSTTVVGAIEAANALCEAGQTLKLKAKRPEASRFRTISSGVTDSFGLVGFQVKVERTKVYRVVAPTAGECVRAKSSTRKIRAI